MTPTGDELWMDYRFIEKRIREQKEYIKQLEFRFKMGMMYYSRFIEIYQSAHGVLQRLEQQSEYLDAVELN